MKKLVIFSIMMVLTLAVWSNPAGAHYFWMELDGAAPSTVGDLVTADVYLHAETDDDIQFWGFSLGFDSDELQYDSWSHASLNGDMWAQALPFYGLEAGGSEKYPGEDRVKGISGENLAFPPRYEMSADEDVQLASVTFSYLGGVLDGAEDLWIEFNSEMNEGAFWWSGIGQNNTNVDPARAGADVGAPVPVPAAVWLLGSGLLGLFGIRRRNQ